MKNPDPPTRIFLVRHGVARGAEGVAVGQIDLPLSAAGAAAIGKLADTWTGPPPDRLITSGLARADGTAAILGRAWNLEATVDARLREIDFGDWDGRTWKDIRAEKGDFLKEWMESWWTRRAPGGEGFEDVARRAVEWLDETVADAEGETVVAVGHGGTIRTALGHVLGLPLERAFHLHLDHGHVSSLITTWRGPEVDLTNADRFPENVR